MLTATGLVVLPKNPELCKITEKVYGKTFYINFNAVTKNPYQKDNNGKQLEWLKVTMRCTEFDIEQARQLIKPGQRLFIRFAELGGNLLESGYAAMNLSTKFSWVESVSVTYEPGTKEE